MKRMVDPLGRTTGVPPVNVVFNSNQSKAYVANYGGSLGFGN
jgi:hypothetical protein